MWRRPLVLAGPLLLVSIGASEAQTTALLSEPDLSARLRGLAGVAIAVPGDVSLVAANPATAAGIGDFAVTAAYLDSPPELDLTGIDLAIVAPVGALGSFAARFANRDVTDVIEGLETSPAGFEVYDRALELAWARPLGERFGVGVRGRVLWSRVFASTAKVYAADIGALVQPASWLWVGITSSNLVAAMSTDGLASEAPPAALRLGASAGPVELGPTALTGYVAGFWLPEARESGGGLAAQATVLGTLSLRAGYSREPVSFGDPLSGFALGIGVRVGPLALDLARRLGGEWQLPASTYLSLTWQPQPAAH